MAIYARRNLVITSFGPNIILTQPLESGQTLIFDSSKQSFVNEPGNTSAVIVVPDISSRDALSPTLSTGQMIYVQDTGSGEYGLYMWNGTSFVTIATQDSAAADANTTSYLLEYNSPATITLGNIEPGHRAVNITINVLTPFNGVSPSLSIGDAQFGPTGLMDSTQIDLTSAQDYVAEGTYVYTGTSTVDYIAYFNADGSTVGQAEIIVSYV